MFATQVILTCIGVLLVSASACAHPFHASTTEIEWNSDSRRFEVATRLRISDLEDAVSAKQKSRFHLEADPQRHQPLQDYLQEHFSVTFADDQSCRMHWVGCELELHDVWIYVEIESVPGDSEQKYAVSAKTNDAITSRKISRWDDLFSAKNSRRGDESAATSETNQIRIRNTALLEVQPQQVNLIVFTVNNRTVSTTLTAAVREQIVDTP